MAKVTPEDLESLVRLFDGGDWDELRLVLGETEIFLSKDPAAAGFSAVVPPASTASAASASAIASSTPAPVPTPRGGAVPDGWAAVRAPSLGTFYRSPKPGAPSYVEVGQAVTAETEACLIEVMKLFTAVRAGVAGTLRRICAADGDLVEFDQVLFLIEPHG